MNVRQELVFWLLGAVMANSLNRDDEHRDENRSAEPPAARPRKPLASVLETCLYASDLHESLRFYGEVLGLELIQFEPDRHLFFRLSSQVLLVFNPTVTSQPGQPLPPHGSFGVGHVCFRVSQSEQSAWEEHLEKHSVSIEKIINWPQGGRSIYFNDPAGNLLEFASRELWGFSSLAADD